MTLPSKMRVISHEQGKNIDDLEIVQAVLPSLSDDEVLIKVTAFGINRADTLQRQGKYPAPKQDSDIMGLEVSGSVVATGSNVEQWRTGDEVIALVAGGGYSEYVSVLKNHVMAIPTGVEKIHAAGLMEVFLTAYQSLFWLGKLAAKQRVLIHAGASGVGLAAIQLAKHFACQVAVTASSEKKLAVCRELGADIGINYHLQDFADELQKEDFAPQVIIDFVGAQYTNRNLQVLDLDGVIVQLAMLNGRKGDELDMAKLLEKRASLKGSTLRNRSDQYKASLISEFDREMSACFHKQDLQVVVDKVLPAEQIAEAHRCIEQNETSGKVICHW